MHLPHTLHCCQVWCYILRIHNTYWHSKCLLSQLYNNTSCFVQWQSTLLCLATHRFTSMCHFSKQFTMHRPTSHLLQKYGVLHVCFFREHTRHRLFFPLEGQCCGCFTSKRLSWDANGLDLPLEMLLALIFSSCERIIRSRTRTAQKLLWVILPPLDLCIRNEFRMVTSVRWKNNFLVHFQVLWAIP